MTPSNKNEIMAFWESDQTQLELPHALLTKEIEPMGSRQVIAMEFLMLEPDKDSDNLLARLCNKYNGDWANRQDETYYIYFTDPDDAVWFVNDAAWVSNMVISENKMENKIEVHISCDGCGGRAGFRPIVWDSHIFTGAVYDK